MVAARHSAVGYVLQRIGYRTRWFHTMAAQVWRESSLHCVPVRRARAVQAGWTSDQGRGLHRLGRTAEQEMVIQVDTSSARRNGPHARLHVGPILRNRATCLDVI